MFVVWTADLPRVEPFRSPEIGLQLPELCSSDQPPILSEPKLFIEAMSPRSEGWCSPPGKKTIEYEPYRQQADTEIA
jgi:hypothetical protein